MAPPAPLSRVLSVESAFGAYCRSCLLSMAVLTGRVFPLLWFGFLACFVGMAFFVGKPRGENMVGVAVATVLTTAVGLVAMRRCVCDLADEERIRLIDIVNSNQYSNPRRISLRLRKPCRSGDEMVFMSRTNFNLNPFARDPIAERLIRLVDLACLENKLR